MPPICLLLLFMLYEMPLRAECLGADVPLTPIGQCFTLQNGLAVRLYATDGGQKERTEVRLAMRVGSAFEAEDEEGIAHCIEHMAFAPEWIMHTLAGYGNRYGADFNAYTGYDRTVYSFSIPSGCDSAMGDALRVVRYWLAGMQFHEARLEQEKGVIVREIADFTPDDHLSEVKLAGNPRYGRFPIGSAERVKQITSRKLSAFYRRHYTPRTATLIVAGPIDTLVYRTAIAAALGDISSRRQPPKQPDLNIFASQVPSHSAHPLGSDSTCVMDLFWPYSYGEQQTRGQWLRNVCVQACVSTLNEQLYQHGSPLAYSIDWYLNHEGFISLAGKCASSREVDTILSQAMGVLRGVAMRCEQKEFFYALRDKALEIALRAELPISAVAAADRMVSETFVEVEGGATVSERKWITDAIGAIDTAEWRSLLRHVVPSGAPLVTHLKGCDLSRDQIGRAVAKGDNFAMLPTYAQFVVPDQSPKTQRVAIPAAYAQSPFPYALPQRKENLQSMDAKLYTIGNGIPLLAKRTYGDDSVAYIVATWRGGLLDTSLYGREVQEALSAVLDLCSVPGLSLGALDSLMYQEGVSVLFTISGTAHRVMMACPVRKVGLAMRLLRQRLLTPVWDTAAYTSYREDCIATTQTWATGPRREMRYTQRLDALATRLMDPAFSVEEPGAQAWRSLRINDLHRYFTTLYAQGDGLQIVAVGPVEEDTLAHAVAKNFDLPCRSIPFSGHVAPPLWRPESISQSPKGGAAAFISYWRGNVPERGLRGTLIVKLMRDALQDEVLRTLRHERQLVYSPFVTIQYDMVAAKSFMLIVNGECESTALAEAKQAAEAAVKSLASGKVTEARMAGYRRAFLASKDRSLTPYAPTAWRDWIVESLEDGITPAELNEYEAILNSVTPSMLRSAFQHLLNRHDEGFVAIPQ